MLDDEEQSRTLIRLEAKLDVLENLKADIEPWRMEERDVSAREALANVIAHIDAEIIELHRRSEAAAHPIIPGGALRQDTDLT
jgi:hypothetical protein